MEEWKEYKLSELLEIPIRIGLTKPKAIRGQGVKMIGMKEIFAYDIIRNCDMELVPITDKELASSSIIEEDLLFARQSLTLEGAGKCSIVGSVNDDTVFESHLIRVRINKKLANPYFIYYYFNSRYGKEQIKGLVQQVAAAGIRGKELINLMIKCPSLPTQQKIAKILSSLDDKIEVNRRINEQLEELAQALFKSWFVDFEPFKDGEFVESELGMIPKGWKVGKLGELCQFKRGKNLLSKNAILGGVPVVAGGLEPSCYHNVSNTKSPVVTISGSGANAGFMRMYHQEVWASDCSYIDSSCRNLLFVYFFLANNRKLLKHAQTGAVQPHVKPSDIHDFDIVIPPLEIIDKFQNLVSSSTTITGNNQKEITNLSNLCDTLLPKLMKGEIEL